MTSYEFLIKIKILSKQIDNKTLELEVIKRKMQQAGVSLTEHNSSTRNTKSPQERIMMEYIEFQEELEEAIAYYMNYKRKAIKLIDMVNNADCIDVLYKRFIQLKELKQVAKEKNLSYQGASKLQRKAIKLFDEVYNNVCITK